MKLLLVKELSYTIFMEKKLKCAIVDGDPKSHQTIIEFLKKSPIVEIAHSFYKPSDLLQNIHTIAIDVVFLDILFANDTIQGFDIAPLLKAENKIIIFISGRNEFIIEACKYAGATDVIPKPANKEKLLSSLLKAWKIISAPELNIKEYELFYVAERKAQISILLSDIYFVKTATGDPRNKEITLKNNEKFTLMDCKFGHLLQRSPKLAQINISELVSYSIVDAVLHDAIFIKPTAPIQIPRVLTLSKTHRKEFKINFS
jgi:DNA-binding LytR/AlgR family response regulator